LAFVIEDGSIVDGATSYATVAEARAYALDRGVTLPASNTTIEQMLVKACDYLQSLESKFKGYCTSSTQSLAWPRIEVEINCEYIASDSIPTNIKSCQIQLAMLIHAGFDLLPTVSPQSFITKEKIGPIETEFANPIQSGISQKFNSAMYLLEPFFNYTKSTFITRRV
jgi:hypothetical protein